MKSKWILLLMLVLTLGWSGSSNAGTTVIEDFFYDGCSSVPEGMPCNPDLWCDCCLVHDIAYWKGGTWDDRLKADTALKECVTKKSGSAALGEAFFVGVRAGGSPYYNTSYRWGFGWDFGRGYKAMTAQEAAVADEKLSRFWAENPNPCAAFNKFP